MKKQTFKIVEVLYTNGTSTTFTLGDEVEIKNFLSVVNNDSNWFSICGECTVWINKQNVLNITLK